MLALPLEGFSVDKQLLQRYYNILAHAFSILGSHQCSQTLVTKIAYNSCARLRYPWKETDFVEMLRISIGSEAKGQNAIHCDGCKNVYALSVVAKCYNPVKSKLINDIFQLKCLQRTCAFLNTLVSMTLKLCIPCRTQLEYVVKPCSAKMLL